MKHLITFALVVFLACAVPVHSPAQTLTDTEVAAAIKAGTSNKFEAIAAGCNARPGFGEVLGAGIAGGVQRDGGFTVAISTNAGRIAALAAAAKRQYLPFTIAHVNETLRAPAIFVGVEPDNPSRGGSTMSVAASVQHVVLRSKGKAQTVIQPINVTTETLTWSNLLGGSVDANRAVANFDPAAMRELPPGDFDVIIITTHGERRCKIGAKDRMRVFGR